MKHVRAFIVTLSCCFALAGPALANEIATTAIGKKVDPFSLQDFRGKSHKLADLHSSKVVVVAFLGVECPLSKLYAPRLVDLAKKYEPKGVAFLGVDSNRQDSVTKMAQYAQVHGVKFPLLKDLNNTLADALGATRNPQVFVLDSDRIVRYAGRVDDQYGFETGSGYARRVATKHDLASALDDLLAGKKVTQPATEAIGCLIGRVRPADNSSEVTYSKQIARIFRDHCVECHRPGQIGPFALQTYDQAVGWADMIDEVVREKRMPPWHADPKYGHFVNDISLSNDDRDLIFKWVAKGAPEGNPQDLPAPKKYQGSWMMPGGPDAVFYMTDKPVDVQAEGTVDYRYYVVDTGFTEDKWIQVAECLPDNRAVVHHMIVFLKPPGGGLFEEAPSRPAGEGGDAAQGAKGKAGGERKDAQVGPRRRGGGQAAFGQLCGFAPGTRPYVLPEGMAKLIPAGWQLVFQMHYTPNGSPQKDRSSVGIKFADPAKVKYRVATANATNHTFVIPAGEPNYQVESKRTYGADVLMLSVFPHMHLRGKDFRYEVIYPDGAQETIMNMPRYDFNWQTSYIFGEAKKLPKGTTLHCTAHFDNSADNPANPDPTKKVRWGPQTWHEMMIGWFDIAVPKGTDIQDVLPPETRGNRSGQGRTAE